MANFNSFVVLIGLLVTSPVRAQPACEFENMSAAQCGRVQAVLGQWKAPALTAVVVAVVADHAPAAGERPDLHLDQANARDAATERAIGPCRYNEASGRIELQASAFALADEALTSCMATAYAHARYHAVEAAWLRRVGAHEAWIAKGGVLAKVAVEPGLPTPAARALWASLATRELVNVAQQGTAPKEGRAIASTPDVEVRELLGLN